MQDLETESLWSQPSGECIQGELEGNKLTLFPAIHTTFAGFKKSHPNGQLLKKEAKGPHGSPYADYFDDQSKLGMFGRLDNFERLPGKALVFGLRLPEGEVAITKDYLEEHGHAEIGEGPIVMVSYDPESKTVRAIATQSQTTSFAWPVPVITSYWFAWASFFPDSELIK